MTQIPSNFADDLERFGGGPPVEQQMVPDDAALAKATLVLRMFKDAALREPYQWNEQDATRVWAAAMATIHIDVIEAAIGDWINQPDNRNYPAIGEFLAVCRGVQLDMDTRDQARNRRLCSTCHGDRWVRVVDGSIDVPQHMTPRALIQLHEANEPWPTVHLELHHMAPCPTCPVMSHRRALYDGHHFTADHLAGGGCPQCWEYTDPPKHRARAKATASAGSR